MAAGALAVGGWRWCVLRWCWQDDTGSCWFVVPAGGSYNCSMEWGATAVSHSSATPMRKSLFGAASSSFPSSSSSSSYHRYPSTRGDGSSSPSRVHDAPGVDRSVVSEVEPKE